MSTSKHATAKNPTQDLFEPPSTAPQTHTVPTFDTQQITDIYLTRPASMASWSLGYWFIRAHNLDNWNLENAVGTAQARRMILANGYNRLELSVLVEFNKEYEDK